MSRIGISFLFWLFFAIPTTFAKPPYSFSVRSDEFARFKSSFLSLGEFANHPGPSGYLLEIESLRYLNAPILAAFAAYLSAFAAVNEIDPADLHAFHQTTQELLDQLEEPTGPLSPEATQLIERMAALTRYLQEQPVDLVNLHTPCQSSNSSTSVEEAHPSARQKIMTVMVRIRQNSARSAASAAATQPPSGGTVPVAAAHHFGDRRVKRLSWQYLKDILHPHNSDDTTPSD